MTSQLPAERPGDCHRAGMDIAVFGDCAFADEKKPKLSSARNTPAR
jgi:hypothetical protein